MMELILGWLYDNWRDIVVPAATFFAALIAALWLRKWAMEAFAKWLKPGESEEKQTALRLLRRASLLLCLILSVCLGLAVSLVPEGWKSIIGRALWSLFVLSLAVSATQLTAKLVPLYGGRLKAPQKAVRAAGVAARITILLLAILILLDMWGAPTSPLLLLIGLVVLVAIVGLRNAIPDWAAGFTVLAGGQVKAGDYIKLGSGEEGYVREVGWSHVVLTGLDDAAVTVPNRKLVEVTVVNYGRPLKKAKGPFRFYTRTHLTELTGLKARNLRELADIFRSAPDSMVYYHTHHFLEEHHYLTPEPANDLAVWVADAMGDDALAERLASVDTFEFATLALLRDRLTSIMDEHVSRGGALREVTEGREFYPMKSISFILQTPYVAHDLREFAEALRKLSLSSLYFHMFESRLRLGRGLNDFSTWLRNDLEEEDMAEYVARLDPYTYTLEGLRSTLIQLIEKRIK